MQYLCSCCRRPLQTGQTMCGCGQLFDRVPEYNPNSPSSYWPWASASKPAMVQWWNDISPAMKASVFGGVALRRSCHHRRVCPLLSVPARSLRPWNARTGSSTGSFFKYVIGIVNTHACRHAGSAEVCAADE